MPSYTTYGNLDDRILKDGDVGFVGFNNRLRPDQLQTGVLADAQNIRLDRNGEAQVRKGVELVLAPLAVDAQALSLPFTLPTVGQEGDGVTAILNDDLVNAIYGSTGFSDPSEEASQYIIIAANSKAFAIKVSDGTSTEIDYPSGVNISQPVDMIQAFNKVFIFRNGQRALEWDGDFSGTPEFTKVASGEYSQPKQLSPSSVDIVDGKATATFSSVADLNGTQVGDTIEIEAIGNSTLVVGEKYVVAERDDSGPSISFFVQHPNVNNANGVIFQQPVSVGLGFTHMPAPPFATYHQRRLVMPFNFDVGGTDATPTFTSREVLDEIIASDILDSDTYDQIFGSYRFNAGTADFVVGLHSFSDDTLMVFNRNSIHVVKNTIDLNNSTIQLLTDEVGCVARKSIQQVGNRVIFLSDNGVYGTEFLDEYNLRGTSTPLSEPINETIKEINKQYWDKSVSTYFDNRYFLAVPMNGADQNTRVLVYNFLNQQWESVDSFEDPNFHVSNLIVVGDGNDRGVYAVNDIGGVHKLYDREDGIDRVITQIGGSQQNLDIPASLRTRQFTYGTLERKKFKEFEMHIQSSDSNASDFDISIEVENPDSTEAIGSLRDFNDGDLPVGEDVSIRARMGNRRGYGTQFTINNTSGRPRIRAIQVSASDSFRSTQKAI